MKRCYSCMAQIEDDKASICPQCGYHQDEEVDTSVYLKPGTALHDKYMVGKVLGYGGFGITYAGWDMHLNRKVCIKEYFPRNLSRRVSEEESTVTVTDSEQIDRFRMGLRQFLEEARSLANLANVRGIVEIHSFFEANHTGYIIMEFLEGQDVKGMLKSEGGKFTYQKAEYIILTVLHTLNEIHKKNVLHRDIAPDNIFVTNEGVIKLIDFGAAKHAAAQANANAEILLKEGYAPLEQYRRDTRQGTYTDIYAVAALFYRMLTGKKPPSSRNRFKEDTLKTVSDMGVEVPDYAEMAIMTSLNLQPQHRIQTAYEFMEALNGADFVPRYEPDWILPHTEEVKKTGFPALLEKFSTASVSIKIAVICLMLIIAGGCAFGIVQLMPDGSVEVAANGEGTITVTVMEGKSLSEVKEDLKKMGILDVHVTYVLNAAAYETVLSQSKAAGSVVDIAQDSSIDLTVSGGSQYVTLNNYVEKSLDEAKKAIETDGVPYQINEVCSDEKSKGTVYDQSVAPGEVVDVTATKVALTVSRGPKSDFDRTIPNFSGMSVEKVKEKLKELELDSSLLTVKTEKESGYNSEIAEGKVGSQSIKAGQKLNLVDLEEHKKTIILYTSRGEEPKSTSSSKSNSGVSGNSSSGSSGKKKSSSNSGGAALPNIEANDDYGNLW